LIAYPKATNTLGDFTHFPHHWVKFHCIQTFFMILYSSALLYACFLSPVFAQISPINYAALFEQQVDKRLEVPDFERARYAGLLNQSLAAASIHLDSRQFILLVDASDSVQAAMLFLIAPDGTFHYIGASPVSTGKPGRIEHFKTPPGVYLHSTANPDYRAEGTKNEFGIRGYGAKGMRVYDFGWQPAIRGWGKGGPGIIRFQVHATDPDQLERLLGVAHSKGCVRIPATLNTFLDRYGILDAEYESEQKAGRTSRVLIPGREPTPLAGKYLIVIDSGQLERPAWSPLPAALRKTN
jgi:hypothetical protein